MARDEPTPQEVEANTTPLWKRLLPIVGGLIIVVFLFFFVLPQFIDFEAVGRAIGNIDLGEWLILIVFAFVRFIPEGWVYVAAQPGLTMRQGTQLFLVAETLSNVPPGGLDLISRYQMTRSWGFPPSSSTSATIASWVFAALSKLALPLLALAFLAIRNVQDDDLDFVALVSFIAVVGGAIVFYLVLRSPDLAGRIGEFLGGIVHWVAGIFRKEVKTDFRTLVVEFREQSRDVLRTRTHWGFLAGLAARIAAFLVLLLATRFVGLGSDQVHWTEAFAAYAVTMALTVIPIFNLPGINEVILISVYNSVAGGGVADEVAAAVFVYRILTWLAPIPFGGIAFTRWRDHVRATGKTELLDAFDDADAEPA